MSGTIRLKHLCGRWGEYGLGVPVEDYATEGIRLIRTSDITDDGKLTPTEEGVFVNLESVDGMELRTGDILISRSGTVGRSLVFNEEEHGPCTFAAYLVRFRLQDGVDPRFIYYFTKSLQFEQQIRLDETQATIANFNAQKLGNLAVPAHSAAGRRAIADFLDRETARIDSLLEAEQRMAVLLRERQRRATSDLVSGTGGPLLPLKRILVDVEQGWSPQCENRTAEPDEWGVLKVGCVNDGEFRYEENKALPSGLAPARELEVTVGDILMSRANTRELLGGVALVEEVRPRLLLCDKLYRLVPDERRVDRRYLVAALRTHEARHGLEREATGASNSMQNVSQDAVLNVLIPVPPLSDQKRAADRVAERRARMDATLLKIGMAQARLRERRQALVTAAVTGSIDHRIRRWFTPPRSS